MEVMNGKIVAIDEDELFGLYLKRGMDDIFSFPEYIERFKAAGTLILPGKQEDENVGNAATMPTQTNADRIRAMSDEELAKEMLFFCPTDTVFKGEDTYGMPHYTGLDGGYYATSEEVVASNLDWLKQPADGGR